MVLYVLFPEAGILGEHELQNSLRSGYHSTKFDAREWDTVLAHPPVRVENGLSRLCIDEQGYPQEKWKHEGSAHHGSCKVQHAFRPPRPGVEEVVLYLHRQGSRKVAGRHRRVGQSAEVRDKQNVPEGAASPANERCQVRAPDVRRGEDYGVHATSASDVLGLGHGLLVGVAVERLPRQRQAPVDEGGGGVSQPPFLFQELDRSGARVLISYNYHGSAPNTEPPHSPPRQTLHKGRKKQNAHKA